MAEQVKSLADFYDPTRTAQVGLQYMQGQQMLAGQQQARDQQGANMAIDNARQAYTASNPMDSYPAYVNFAKMSGLPVPDVNTFYASPQLYDNLLKHEPGTPQHDEALGKWLQTDPRSRAVVEKEVGSLKAFRGAQNINVAAGLGGDENTAELTRQSGPMQSQISDALAQSPLEKAKAQAIEQKVREHEEVTTNVNTQLGVLIPMMKAAGLAIERTTPHVEQLAGIQETYDRNVKSMGITKAANIRRETILTNPTLQGFTDRRMQSIPNLEQAVQQLEDARGQLETRAEMVARGVAPLQDGESLAVLAGKVDASSMQLGYQRAQLAFAKDPTRAKLNELKTVKAQMDDAVTTLTERKSASQESLDVRRAGLDEKIVEDRRKEAHRQEVAKAQIELANAGDQKQAGRIAAKYPGVSVEEILPAIKDPNKAGIEIKMPGTTGEAGQFAMIDNAVKNIEAVSKAITKADGSVDRAKVFASAFNIPFTEGRNISSMMEDAISAKLRAETGAAANASEVESIKKRFDLSTLDTDSVVKDKLSRLRRFMDETRVIRDPTGKIREVAKGGQTQTSPAPSSGTVAPFNDAQKEQRYQEWKKSHK